MIVSIKKYTVIQNGDLASKRSHLKITYDNGEIWSVQEGYTDNSRHQDAMDWVAEGNTIEEGDD